MAKKKRERNVSPSIDAKTLTLESRLTPPEVAHLIRMSPEFLAQARVDGDGPLYEKLGRSIRYRWGDVLTWLRTRARSSTSEHDL
jgi:hypothetical protein